MSDIDIKSMFLDEIISDFKKFSLPAYRSKQVYNWLSKGIQSFDEMSDLPVSLREDLKRKYYIPKVNIEKKMISDYDGTIKYLFKLDDGEYIESVLMKYHHGYSICISTQVGCKMGCRFCATGKSGFSRNLMPSEMLSQIQLANQDNNIRVSNIVLMGMGEPLDNYNNVVRFLKLVSSPDGMNIGMRHISLSTCGIIDKIYKLAKEKFQLTLSVSLHAPNNEVRNKIMPINNRFDIDELLKACRFYIKQTNRRISFEYAMISGVNDGPECATELSKKLKSMLCHVNLIPLNNSETDNKYKKSNMKVLERFRCILLKSGVPITIRRTLGSDIDASCGQLRRRIIEEKREGERVKIYGKTDTGIVRKTNQDSFDFGVINDSFSWAVVCDGVGGTNSGDVASHLATEVVRKKINEIYSDDMSDDAIKELLISCVEFASFEIFNKSREDKQYFGMRTTVVLVAVRNNIIHVAHVGDSRAYLILQNSMKQLTIDHSMVQELIKKGEITKEEAKSHPKKNIITRSLGAQSDIEVDYVQHSLPNDSSILVCTDGLSNYIEQQELLELFKTLEKEQLVEALINYANKKGGSDNITALVITR